MGNEEDSEGMKKVEEWGQRREKSSVDRVGRKRSELVALIIQKLDTYTESREP